MKIFNFLRNEFKFQFQSSFVFYGYLIGILINLLVYYFTSKAFVPTLGLEAKYLEHGYFEYIILGELCLLVAQISISEGQDAFFRYKESGVLELFYFSSIGLKKALTYLYGSLVLLTFIYLVSTIFFSSLFFSISLTLVQIFRLFLLQIMSGLFFVGLYYLNLTISALIGRRNGSIQHVVNLLTFFSGAYFPLELIGSETIRLILKASPFSLLVQFSRDFIYEGKLWGDEFLGLTCWFFVTMGMALAIYSFFIKKNGMGKYVSP